MLDPFPGNRRRLTAVTLGRTPMARRSCSPRVARLAEPRGIKARHSGLHALPPRFSLGPSWAVPAVEALLLVAIIAIDRGRIDRRSAAGRTLSLGLVAVLVPTLVR